MTPKFPPLLGVLLACPRGSVGASRRSYALCGDGLSSIGPHRSERSSLRRAAKVLTSRSSPPQRGNSDSIPLFLTHSSHFVQSRTQGTEIREGASGESRGGAQEVLRHVRDERSSRKVLTRPCDGGPRPNHPVSPKHSPGIALIPHDQIGRGLLHAFVSGKSKKD